MKFNELNGEYMKMCHNQECCDDCKYNSNFFSCELSFGYDKGKSDAIDECINTITNLCGGLPNINIIGALKQLKKQNNE